MKLLGVVGVVALAVALQTALSRYTVGTSWAFDLVLVGTVYAALRWGASAGVLAGTLGGVTQDALAGGVVGVGGLAGTVVGFLSGVLGQQFILTRPVSRMLLTAGATLMHRGLIVLIRSAIDRHFSHGGWLAMLGELVLNGLAAFVVYQGIESLPRLVGRRTARRSGLGARKW